MVVSSKILWGMALWERVFMVHLNLHFDVQSMVMTVLTVIIDGELQ